MDLGTFFIPSESYGLTNNSQIFYYLPYREKNGNYPFFIAFSEDKVNLYFAGEVEYKKTINNKEEKAKEYISATLILSLRLYNDKQTKKELGESLVNVFDLTYPSFSDYTLSVEKNPSSDNLGYKEDKVLDEFSLKPQSKEKAALSNILLDFLYDVKHSFVFNESSQYGKIKHLLKESEFLQAIASKAEFYFHFSKLGDKLSEIEIEQTKSSFTHWLELLREHNIHKTIKPKNKWFKDVETEMHKALDKSKKINDQLNKYLGEQNHAIIWSRKKIKLLNNYVKCCEHIPQYRNKVKKWSEERDNTKERIDKYKKNKKESGIAKLKEENDRQRELATSWFIERNNIFRAWLEGDLFQRALFVVNILVIFLLLVCFIGQTLNFFNPIFIENQGNLYYLFFSVPLLLALFFIYAINPLFNLETRRILIAWFKSFYKKKTRSVCFKIIITWFKLLFKKETWINGINKSIDFIFKSIKEKSKFIKLIMLPLWALLFGATHLVFETQSFYNITFIKNLFTYEFAIYFFVLLISISITKVIVYSKKSCKLNNKVMFALFHYLLLGIAFAAKKIHLDSFWLYTGISIILFIVLFNHEKESHPNLLESTSINKTFSMLFYGLVISFLINVFYINTEYKEYLERYEYLGHIWHHTKKNEAFKLKEDAYVIKDTLKLKEPYFGSYKIESNSLKEDTIKLYSISESLKDDYYYSYFYVYEPNEEHTKKWAKYYLNEDISNLKKKRDKADAINDSVGFKSLKSKIISKKNKLKEFDKFYEDKKNSIDSIYQYKSYDKVKKSIYQPMSDDIEVTIDKYFFEQLQYVYLYEKDKETGDNYIRANTPVLKVINLFGIKIITIPNILFINTFLSLFVAVILQIFINKTGFLKGGSSHGH